MEQQKNKEQGPKKGLLQSEELYEYILDTSVYPREPAPLKELRHLTASHPEEMVTTQRGLSHGASKVSERVAASSYDMATAPDATQLMAMFLKLINAKKTIEIGVFTGYSLLLTALTIPDDGEIVAIDVDRNAFKIGLPIIKRAGVEHKINFIESEALPVLDKLLEDHKNEGTFDFAYVDADKENYLNYHEKLLKLVRVGGIIAYDNTLWEGSVAVPEESVPESLKFWRRAIIEVNKSLANDLRIQISHVPVGDGTTFCMRMH